MSQRKRKPVETKKLMALAFNDAVRDILRADGVFKLSDDKSRDAIWEFDGLAWKRVALPGHEGEAPTLEIADDEAVASAG